MQQAMPDVGIIKSALKLACRAPSIHNSQPWHWVLEGSALRVFVDHFRLVNIADCSGREAIISCGATLDHLRIAMAALGWQAVIERFPESDNRDLLASVGFRPRETVSEAVCEVEYERAEAILERRTDRLPLRPPNFWASFEPELRKTIGDSDSDMLDVLSNNVRAQLASASLSTNVLRCHDPSYQTEIQWWTAPFALSTGIPPDALPSSSESLRVDIARDFPATDDTDRRSGLGADWSTILVLSTGETPEQTYCTVARCCPPCFWNAPSPAWPPAR